MPYSAFRYILRNVVLEAPHTHTRTHTHTHTLLYSEVAAVRALSLSLSLSVVVVVTLLQKALLFKKGVELCPSFFFVCVEVII